ncbi:MAG: hypothetical protein QM708_05640 [Propioniciclava sp.]|uniref:sensor histidine kinase n=1 Tax=Propioniciclava sp. TaxID=2038686 RepID=UPI0039E5F2D3
MGVLATLNLATLTVALVAVCLLIAGQTLHVHVVAARRQVRAGVLAYEVLLVGHLIVTAAIITAAAHGEWWTLHTLGLHVPLEPLLWGNAVVAVLGAALRWRGCRIALLELGVLLACTPPVLRLSGDGAWIVLLVVLCFFAARVASELVLDLGRPRRELSQWSTTEAIVRLPQGLLLADDSGRIRLMNDAMRACLIALGFPTDLADARQVWTALRAKAADEQDVIAEDSVVLRLPDDRMFLFSLDSFDMGGAPCWRLLARDITDEDRLIRRLARTNDELARAASELRASLANVRDVARGEALLAARARVHDVIGQRLSILHRYLEDDEITDASLASLEPMLRAILCDLSEVGRTESAAELDGIVTSFSLIDVRVSVEGELPAAPAAADTFVQVIREAATNAVRHGQARAITVVMTAAQDAWRLSVSNDGTSPAAVTREGLGLRGMRHAVCELGGTLSVMPNAPFTVEVAVPRRRSVEEAVAESILAHEAAV